MKRFISNIAIGTTMLLGGGLISTVPAFAATTPTLVLSGGNAVFGLDPAVISGTASAQGVIKFSAAGAVIKGCEALATADVTPFVAKCSWLPAASGSTILTATFTPKDETAFTAVDAAPFTVKVGVPVQGVVSPIHIYVDTVLGSGTTGVLGSRFGVSCAVSGEFIVGQTIVFRVYANNEALGGAVMDSSNTEKAYIEIAGVAAPVTLAYGNHSGAAFWTGVLKTGTATGLYNTLGVISYKITMIAKAQTAAQAAYDAELVIYNKTLAAHNKMMASATAAVAKAKSAADKKNTKATVATLNLWKVVAPVKPSATGAVGTWQSNFMPASQLNLYAVPKV